MVSASLAEDFNTEFAELEAVLDSLGEDWGKEPSFGCVIGDSRFQHLLNSLRYNAANLDETSAKRYEKRLGEIAEIDDELKKKRAEYLFNKFRKVVERGQGIDYSDKTKEEWEKRAEEFSNSQGKLIGKPLQVADTHGHAYDPIIEILRNSDQPVTIVRLDAHTDCVAELEDKVDGANYLSQILFDSELSKKVSKVISTYGGWVDTVEIVQKLFWDKELEAQLEKPNNSMKINGVPYWSIGLRDLPMIEGPTIIDVDLDGCECLDFMGMPGGHVSNFSTDWGFEHYNQVQIMINPRLAASILRTQVQDPKMALVAFERAYRNRLFWDRIERDFVDELCS